MIRMNDFRADPDPLIRTELAACERVVRSGWYVLGEEVKRFEAEWAVQCSVAHAVGTGNGLDAIEIGIRALGLGSGDEIVTTPMTAFATVLGILRAGCVPVLADICPDTALLDRESVGRCIGPRTRGVLLVHLYGQVREMAAWQEFCVRRGLALLEDCAQSHLAAEKGRTAGGFGAFGAYSFYPTKNLGAVGDAGAVVTDDAELARQARMLRNYGQVSRYEHAAAGLNSRLDELQAGILQARLGWLDRFTRRRREIAERYLEEIDNPKVRLLARPSEPASHVYHLFVVLSGDRDRLAAALKERDIETLIHYPIPAHEQPAAGRFKQDPAGLGNAERHARECLSIPCHHNLTDGEVGSVIRALNEFE